MELYTAKDYREQAKRHRELADLLEETADRYEGRNHRAPNRDAPEPRSAKRKSPSRRKRESRLSEMQKFIESHGGHATRKEIIEGTKMPVGTVAYLLKPKNGFIRDEGGKWSFK